MFKATDFGPILPLIREGIQANLVLQQSVIFHLPFHVKLFAPWPKYNLDGRFKAHKGRNFFLFRLDICNFGEPLMTVMLCVVTQP